MPADRRYKNRLVQHITKGGAVFIAKNYKLLIYKVESRKMGRFLSVKVLPVTPLLSGVFLHTAFCAYFLRIERVVGLNS